ncbi:MAG TPA: DUF3617 domain-containing protein [Rhizomicrobium sp.]|jgi:hypothetical protein|nr:DUF3617 domain-containing protein [Rhizomicrobium sp.]
MSRRNLYISGAVALGIAAVSSAALAFAGHGKPGLWQISTKIDLGGMGAMPQLSPKQAAQMKALGIQIPNNNTFMITHCMTPQEAAMIKPPPMGRPGHEPDCKMQNMKTDGSSVSADMVCDAKDMKGGGHFAIVYDSPEHYTGKMTMSMDSHGRHMATNTSFEAKWLSADCKGK